MEDRTIFRNTAVEAYQRRTNRDIVPRLTSWPIIISLWMLLAVLLASVALAWSVQVPTYIGAEGVIVVGGAQAGSSGGKTTAAMFVAPDQTDRIHVGQSVHGKIGSSSSGGYVAGKITRVQPGIIGPDAARDRYHLDGATNVISQPSRVVIARLDEAPRPADHAGDRLAARIQVSSQPVLSFFPGLGKLVGGGG